MEKETLLLWPDGAPGASGTEGEDNPSLTLYPPTNTASSGAAMLVLPGGGYGGHAEHEEQPIAEWLSSLGIFTATLKYRLGPKYRHPAMLLDAARGLRTLRANAGRWSIEAQKIGILGFSAGGHLAGTASVHYDGGDPAAGDPIDRVSSRPDLSVLVYPLLEIEGEYSHAGSRINLLGDTPSAEMTEYMTLRRHVTADTPPTLLVTAADDRVTPIEGILHYALALSKNQVPYQLHAYQSGDHGFGLGAQGTAAARWPEEAALWFRSHGFLR